MILYVFIVLLYGFGTFHKVFYCFIYVFNCFILFNFRFQMCPGLCTFVCVIVFFMYFYNIYYDFIPARHLSCALWDTLGWSKETARQGSADRKIDRATYIKLRQKASKTIFEPPSQWLSLKAMPGVEIVSPLILPLVSSRKSQKVGAFPTFSRAPFPFPLPQVQPRDKKETLCWLIQLK